jgi:PAS domain S-box-containing protein
MKTPVPRVPAADLRVEPARILLTDAVESDLLELESALEELGETLVRARSCREAIAMLLDQEFALVILDTRLPDLDGFEAVRRLRQERRLREIPVILVSAPDALPSEVDEAYELGAVDFLVKPLSAAALRAKARVILELYRSRKDLARRIAERTTELEKELVARASSEAALRESEARLSVTLEQIPLGVGVIDSFGRWIVSNAAMRSFAPDRIPSFDPRQRLRWRAMRADGSLIPPEDWPSARALRGERVSPGMEMLFRTDGGREIWTRVSSVPLRGTGGEVVGAVSTVEDIDASKRAQSSFRSLAEASRVFSESDRDLPNLMNRISDLLVPSIADACYLRRLSPDGTQIETLSIRHRDPEVERSERELIMAARQPVGEGLTGQVLRTGIPVFLPVVDREVFQAATAAPFRGYVQESRLASYITVAMRAGGRVVGALVASRLTGRETFTREDLDFIQDLADRAGLALANQEAFDLLQKEKEAHRAGEEQLRAIMESVPAAIWIAKDAEGKTIVGNPRSYDLLRMKPGENISKSAPEAMPYEILIDGRRPRPEELPLQKAGLTGTPIMGQELELRLPDGTSRFIFGNSVPILDAGGKVKQVVAAFVDVTERRAAQEELRRTTAFLRTIHDTTSELIFVRDRDGRLTYANAATLRTLGLSEGGLLTPLEPGPAGGASANDPTRANDLHVMDTGQSLTIEETYTVPDGSRRIFLSTKTPLRNEQGTIIGVIGVSKDVTDRKVAEECLAADLRALRRLNAVGEQCSRPGADFSACLDAILAASIELSSADMGDLQLLDPGTSTLRIVSQRGFSEEFVRYFGIIDSSQDTSCAEATRTARRVIVEDVQTHPLFAGRPSLEMIRRAGVRAVQSTPLLSSAGKVLGVISTHFRQPRRFGERDLDWLDLLTRQAADYVERRRAENEIRALNASLEERVKARTAELSQALRELEAFSYTIAHDLRAPLRTMRGFSEILLDEVGSRMGDEARDAALRVVEGTKRMDSLTRDLLAYASVAQAAVVLEPLDLDPLVDEVLRGFEAEIKAASASVDLIRPLGLVQASATLVSQAVGNLISNACKFVEAGQKPRIAIGSGTLGRTVRLWVRDNGIGIDPRHQPKLFGMFERLEPGRYPGTGIGLAIVRKAAERMGGRVGVESEPGKGSLFWIELPGTQEVP